MAEHRGHCTLLHLWYCCVGKLFETKEGKVGNNTSFWCSFFVVENPGTQTSFLSSASSRLVLFQLSPSSRNTTSVWRWRTNLEGWQRATVLKFLREVWHLNRMIISCFICRIVFWGLKNPNFTKMCKTMTMSFQCLLLWSGTEWAQGWRTPPCPGLWRETWLNWTSSVKSLQIHPAWLKSVSLPFLFSSCECFHESFSLKPSVCLF